MQAPPRTGPIMAYSNGTDGEWDSQGTTVGTMESTRGTETGSDGIHQTGNKTCVYPPKTVTNKMGRGSTSCKETTEGAPQ